MRLLAAVSNQAFELEKGVAKRVDSAIGCCGCRGTAQCMLHDFVNGVGFRLHALGSGLLRHRKSCKKFSLRLTNGLAAADGRCQAFMALIS